MNNDSLENSQENLDSTFVLPAFDRVVNWGPEIVIQAKEKEIIPEVKPEVAEIKNEVRTIQGTPRPQVIQGPTGYVGFQGITGYVSGWGGFVGVTGTGPREFDDEDDTYTPRTIRTVDYTETESFSSDGFKIRTRVGRPRPTC